MLDTKYKGPRGSYFQMTMSVGEHYCTCALLVYFMQYYATFDMLTKTTRLSQPQNKQITVKAMQLLCVKMWLMVDGWKGK